MKNTIHAQITSLNEATITIGMATTFEEKREIYRLRYNIYAEEIAYHLVDVDHQHKLLYDDLDTWAMLLYIRIGSTMIGTGRINIGPIDDFPSTVVQTYFMNSFKKFYDKNDNPNFAVISKGMIIPHYRNSSALSLLMTKIYELYCDYQIQFAFVNCNFHLIPLHEYFGSRRIDNNILDPNIGPMSSLVMLVDDIQHLQVVGSPLYQAAYSRTSLNNDVVNWFHSEFSHEINSTVNSQLVSPDELWNIIIQYLGPMPHHILPILKGLSVFEAAFFFHRCSTIVHCHIGDYVVVGSSTSQELIVLLSGIAHCSLQGIIRPGQYCGENGLVNRTIHLSSVIAVKESNILVFSFHYFNKFRKSHPAIAKKILYNLGVD